MYPVEFAKLALQKRRDLITKWIYSDDIHNAVLANREFQCTNLFGTWHLSEVGVITLREHDASKPVLIKPSTLMKLKELNAKNGDFRGIDCLDTSKICNWLAFESKHAKRAREQMIQFGGGSLHSAVPAELLAAFARCKTRRTSAGSWWSLK